MGETSSSTCHRGGHNRVSGRTCGQFSKAFNQTVRKKEPLWSPLVHLFSPEPLQSSKTSLSPSPKKKLKLSPSNTFLSTSVTPPKDVFFPTTTPSFEKKHAPPTIPKFPINKAKVLAWETFRYPITLTNSELWKEDKKHVDNPGGQKKKESPKKLSEVEMWIFENCWVRLG